MSQTNRGVGRFFVDGVQKLPAVDYVVYEEDATPPRVLKRIHGRLSLSMDQGMSLMMLPIGPNTEMELHLEDGRVWGCNLQDSKGTLSNRAGWIER